MTASDVMDRYVAAVGGEERIAAVRSLTLKGKLTGNLTTFVEPATIIQEQGTFEEYHKVPNLMMQLVRTDTGGIARMWGCDGSLSWDFYSLVAGSRTVAPGGMHEYRSEADPNGACQVKTWSSGSKRNSTDGEFSLCKSKTQGSIRSRFITLILRASC